MAQPLVGTVKSVLSGDTLILSNPKGTAEKTLSLAYISAPRLKREGDEVRTEEYDSSTQTNVSSHLLSSHASSSATSLSANLLAFSCNTRFPQRNETMAE
jgi:hypothetical protein